MKKIVENIYADNVSPSERGHIIGDLKIEHANAGRYARCFYTKISVSSTVSELLKEKYGTGMIYLYIGFTNLGNHEVNYGGELLNRCSKEYNQIKYLNSANKGELEKAFECFFEKSEYPILLEVFKYIKWVDYLLLFIIVFISMLILCILFGKFLTKKVNVTVLKED